MHRSLESYRLPSRLRGGQGEYGPLPERLTPIFRDREDLSSAGRLGPQIQAALADSEALVVVCSPEAARSPFVESEVLAFKRNGRGHRIYAFIVAGEPNSGGEQECFPNALRFELGADGQLSATPANPIAADAREGKDGKARARLKLLAGLFGLPLDIRHIAFSSAYLGYASSALEFKLSTQAVMLALSGVLLIGLVNLAVSFALTLSVAMRARRISFAQGRSLGLMLMRRFLRRPQDFLLPPLRNPPPTEDVKAVSVSSERTPRSGTTKPVITTSPIGEQPPNG